MGDIMKRENSRFLQISIDEIALNSVRKIEKIEGQKYMLFDICH